MKHVPFWTVSARSLVVSLFILVFASSQESDNPISWVNPELPDSPGLTHYIHASVAMRHDVGYVVWTPTEYVHKPNASFSGKADSSSGGHGEG